MVELASNLLRFLSSAPTRNSTSHREESFRTPRMVRSRLAWLSLRSLAAEEDEEDEVKSGRGDDAPPRASAEDSTLAPRSSALTTRRDPKAEARPRPHTSREEEELEEVEAAGSDVAAALVLLAPAAAAAAMAWWWWHEDEEEGGKCRRDWHRSGGGGGGGGAGRRADWWCLMGEPEVPSGEDMAGMNVETDLNNFFHRNFLNAFSTVLPDRPFSSKCAKNAPV